MSFNVDKCSAMNIGHNSIQNNYNMSNLQLPTTDQQRDQGIIIYHQRRQVAKRNREKLQNGQQSTGVYCPQFQVQKQRTDPPVIQTPCGPHLEHAVQFCSPHLRRDIDKMAKIQRRATKMIPEIRNHSYH